MKRGIIDRDLIRKVFVTVRFTRSMQVKAKFTTLRQADEMIAGFAQLWKDAHFYSADTWAWIHVYMDGNNSLDSELYRAHSFSKVLNSNQSDVGAK